MFRVTAFDKIARQIKMKIFAKYSTINVNDKTIGVKQTNKWSQIQNMIKKSQQKQSIQLCQLFLQQKKNQQYHWNAHFELATIYAKLNDNKKASTHFSECIRLNSDSSESYIGLAECLKQQGDTFQAISVLQNSIEKCIRKLDICLKLGEIYCQMEDFIKVFELYSSQINRNDLRVQQILKQSQIVQNINLLILSLAIDPQNQKIALKLKDSFLKDNKVTEGVQFFKFLLQRQHSFTNLYVLGTLLFENGVCLQAKPYFQQAYKINNQHYFVNMFLGTIAQQQGNLTSSISYLQKAFSIDNTTSEPLSYIGFINMQNTDTKKAIQKFSQALSINPNDVLALSCLGTLYISSNINQGINLLRKAIDLDPTNEFALSKLKSTLIMLGRQQQWLKIRQQLPQNILK